MLPKLYAPVWIKFWSLRNGIGENMGVIFDIDREVTRQVRRVLVPNGWKWQLVNLNKLLEWDFTAGTDQEILNEHGSDLEYELTNKHNKAV